MRLQENIKKKKSKFPPLNHSGGGDILPVPNLNCLCEDNSQSPPHEIAQRGTVLYSPPVSALVYIYIYITKFGISNLCIYVTANKLCFCLGGRGDVGCHYQLSKKYKKGNRKSCILILFHLWSKLITVLREKEEIGRTIE